MLMQFTLIAHELFFVVVVVVVVVSYIVKIEMEWFILFCYLFLPFYFMIVVVAAVVLEK
jgi:hypothetical protein